jgi:heptosyltransferase-2
MTAVAGERILLVRLSALGDVVLATAAARALAARRPDARLTFLTRPEWQRLLFDQQWADDVWTLPVAGTDAAGLAALRARIAAAGFSTVVDLQTNLRSRWLLAGHPHRLQWPAARWQRRRWVNLRWTHPAPVRPAWLRFVDALEPLGVDPAAAAPPRLDPSRGGVADARICHAVWAMEDGPIAAPPIVFLAPGSRWASKRWPEASFLAVGQDVVARGGRVLVGGDLRDRAALPRLAAWADAEPRADWFEGPLDVLAELIRGAQAAVSNDSGLLHLAAAVGVPVVAVFGSTHPALGFAPAGPGHATLVSGRSCQPCTLHGLPACPLGHHGCVTDLTVEKVLAALAERTSLPGAAPGPLRKD